MTGDPSRKSGRAGRAPPQGPAAREPSVDWSTLPGTELPPAQVPARERLARLARTLETDVIPRLVQAHRAPAEALLLAAAVPQEADVQAFVHSILSDEQVVLTRGLDQLRARGVRVDSLYVDLFAPAARQLGAMWDDDLCDFSTVTVALGRLQRLLRELSPAFGAEVEHPANGRRALLVQPPDEQHSFGLSMVAEFFRRAGWDVLGGVGGHLPEPAQQVRDEWIDVLGFSVGADSRLAWLQSAITACRTASCNPHLAVIVGGPPFVHDPDLAKQVGADGTTSDAREAPLLAERMLVAQMAHH